jgi:DMSO/TMAO reductase YedYZ molybdopterin-dependent catalytic subunit
LKQKLPPGQVTAKRIFPRHIGSVPKFDPQNWTLTIDDEVEKPLTLRWSDFLSLPSVVRVTDFHCVEGWSVLGNKWEGVAFKTIAEMVGLKPSAKYGFFTCADGYTTSLQLTDLFDDDVLLAYRLNDKPLEPENGAPLRLIVPKKYAYKSPMWLRRITFSSKRELGYWELRGYSDSADPWKNDRYSA